MKMNKDKLNKVYDILVELCGASEHMRYAFIEYHSNNNEYCGFSHEWRFGGKLGFGGKYRMERNQVDCYQEDETLARKKLIKKINIKLKEI